MLEDLINRLIDLYIFQKFPHFEFSKIVIIVYYLSKISRKRYTKEQQKIYDFLLKIKQPPECKVKDYLPPLELAWSCWLICANEEIGSKGGPPGPGPDLLPGGPLGFNGMLLSELFPPMVLSLFDIGPGKRGPPPPGPPEAPEVRPDITELENWEKTEDCELWAGCREETGEGRAMGGCLAEVLLSVEPLLM